VTRPAVLERDGYVCRYCGERERRGDPLQACHVRPTLELLQEGLDVYDPELCVTAHRSCHAARAPHRRPA